MSSKKLPSFFKQDLTSNLENFKGMIFYMLLNNFYELFRIEYDEDCDSYVPQKITSLPRIYYKDSDKLYHISIFLNDLSINHLIENNNIIIFDEMHTEFHQVKAPVYSERNNYFLSEDKEVIKKIPTKTTLDAAYEIFSKVKNKITEEEIKYDISRLSLDGGISAFMECYDKDVTLHLNKKKFHIVTLQTNPNSDMEYPLNEYTNSYIPTEIGLHGTNFVVFDKVEIGRRTINGEIDCILPKEVASIIIGKGGCNMKKLVYDIGLSKLNVKNPTKGDFYKVM